MRRAGRCLASQALRSARHRFPPHVNPRLARLRPYPFERLRQLLAGAAPDPSLTPINLSIGEPRHPTPAFILDALAAGGVGIANYPTTAGPPALREAIAAWLARRNAIASLDPATQVLPVLGSREALFAFAQTVVDASRPGATVMMPNPFYQIYEGAALLAGAAPWCVNADAARGYAPAWHDVPGRRLGAHAAAVRVLAGQSDRPRHDARRMGISLRDVGPARLRDRLRRVLFRGLFRRGRAARWARSPRRARGAGRDFPGSSSSAACRSARMRLGCGRAMPPAMPN